MLWVIQSNVHVQQNHQDLIKHLTKMGVEYVPVRVTPYTKILQSDKPIDNSRLIYTCGNFQLNSISKTMGWIPGVIDQNINMKKTIEHYGEHCLNYTASIHKLKDPIDLPNVFFSRPVADEKLYSGKVFNKMQFNQLRNLLMSRNGKSCKNQLILISDVVDDILAQYRFFVVDGRISTASRYQLIGILSQSNKVDQQVYDFVNEMIAIYQPNIAFVIDIAETQDGFKVIQTNTINSSGFYDIQIDRLIIDINNLQNKYYEKID